MIKAFVPSPRSKVKRMPKRGHYDQDTVYAILDSGFVCHVGYVIDGKPYVTPNAYWREGDAVYWHGSPKSRVLTTLEKGADCCLAVTHLDDLVIARSSFHHSINYHSAMLFGKARKIEDPEAKLAKLKAFMNRLYPGRWDELRPVHRQELKLTTVLGMQIEEASAKIRSGPPQDDAADYALPIWAGVVPVRVVAGALQDNGLFAAGTKAPRNLLNAVRADFIK